MAKTLNVLGIALALLLAAGLATASEFSDISQPAGVADDGLGKGIAFADIDNDGLVDFYVSNKGGANKLYRNQGNGTFADITASAGAGIDHPGFTMGSVFGDYDNDGLIDLYLATGGQYEIEANRLFRNLGNGTFVDVTEKAGVGLKAFTYSASFVDYDNDGDLDLYCANYGVSAKNVLYRNNGDGTFSDVTDAAGVGDPSWSWMGVWADVNNDRRPDLYVVNGRYPAGEPNRLYLNNGNGTFSDISQKSGTADPHWGLGAAFADIDNDGDLDLYVINWGAPNKLYENDQNDNNWLKIKLTGTVSNRNAYGAKVRIFDPANGKLLAMRELRSANGFCAQEPQVLHFGLKSGQSYDLLVEFPSGVDVKRAGIKPGQTLDIVEQAQ